MHNLQAPPIQKPLAGIKVLDLTRVLAGPFCTMVLQDLGAEIIKIENPMGGDDSRAFGPFKNNKSAYFLTINSGKKSVSLNLKKTKAKQIILDLVKQCDVIIENYSPGTMEKLGLGCDIIKATNPKIIYAAISGFGHTGPDSTKPAYDVLVQARGGIMSITGWPETPPTRVGISIGDIGAALYAAIGILSALLQREKIGVGQKVDVSMLDCQIALLENALARYQIDGVPPKPLGNRHPNITPFQAFAASDGFFVIAIGNDNLWEKLCTAVNQPNLISEEKFSNNRNRTVNINEVNQVLSNIFKEKSLHEWITILNAAKVPCSAVNNMEQVFKDEQLKARNMFVESTDPAFIGMKVAGNPIKMTSLIEENQRPKAQEIGESNHDILTAMLGYTAAEIDLLKVDGII